MQLCARLSFMDLLHTVDVASTIFPRKKNMQSAPGQMQPQIQIQWAPGKCTRHLLGFWYMYLASGTTTGTSTMVKFFFGRMASGHGWWHDVCIIVGNKLWFYIVGINDFVPLNLLITSKQICVYKPCLSFYAFSIEFLSDYSGPNACIVA